MISDYYHRQYSLQRTNTKSIKLKCNQYTLQPFMIPEEHFLPNKRVYEDLKDRCQKIKTEFSFIKNEIQREHKKKKEKQEEVLRISKAIFNKENRNEIQKQMSLTCKKLLRLHQSRRLNLEEVKNNKIRSKNKENVLQEIVGQPVNFSPRKHSADKGTLKNSLKSSELHFRHSMANQ